MATSLRSMVLMLCVGALCATSVRAQNAESTDERIRKLERDIVMMQRQLARTSQTRVIGPHGEASPSAGGGAADLELRLSAIEDALRDLRGTLEENEHKVDALNENFEKFQKDTDYRFSEITGGSPSKAAGAAIPPVAPVVKATGSPPDVLTIAPSEQQQPSTQPSGETTAGDGVLHLPSADQPEYSTPRDLYNYAFRLLNQTKYEQSADAFATFINKYPKDPLVGNAYYWQGETYYIRRDYVNAADSFRQGFETLPNGPKAPDNLLKLAMSLDALERDKEACIVLKQITTKYGHQSVNIAEKASSEIRRIGCA